MLPVALDVSTLSIALVGSGKGAFRRLQKLDEAGAANLTVFAPEVGDDFKAQAGRRLVDRLPTDVELQHFQLVLIVDIEDEKAFEMASKAREYGALVNVEDRKDYCDFYYSAIVRRGDLLIGVNTNGQCPTLTVRIRQLLEKTFIPEWAERLKALAYLRNKWRKEGADMKETMARTDRFLNEKGWLGDEVCPRHRKVVLEEGK